MAKFTSTQYLTMTNYFNTLATGWFSGGVIAPFFARVSPIELLLFFVIGCSLSVFCLRISLAFAREVDR